MGDDALLLTLQAHDPATNIISTSIVNDANGINTIHIEGGPEDLTKYRLFSQGGSVFLAVGQAGLVTIGPAVDLASTRIQTPGGQLRTLQQIADAESADGRIFSATWTAEGISSTAAMQVAGTVAGSQRNDVVLSGTGADFAEGGAGDDMMNGGVGNDTLYGGTGSDVLIGGIGDDTLNGGPATGSDGDAINIFFFDRGDGSDRIETTQRPAGALARDIIRFGEGILKSHVLITNTAAGTGSARNGLVIEYGTGDRITLAPGAKTQIAEIRFADGSTMVRSEIIGQLLGVQTAGDDVIHGTESDHPLYGAAGRDGCSVTAATTCWTAEQTAIGSSAAPAPTPMSSTRTAEPTSSMRQPAKSADSSFRRRPSPRSVPTSMALILSSGSPAAARYALPDLE